MTRGEILNLFSGFCPVSGSPVIPTERPEFRVPVKKAGSPQEIVVGDIYFCCTPCVCDTMEFVRTDKVALNTTSGVETFNALVIGNTTLQCVMNASLSKQRLWLCHKNGFINTFATIPALVSFKSVSLNCDLRLILVR